MRILPTNCNSVCFLWSTRNCGSLLFLRLFWGTYTYTCSSTHTYPKALRKRTANFSLSLIYPYLYLTYSKITIKYKLIKIGSSFLSLFRFEFNSIKNHIGCFYFFCKASPYCSYCKFLSSKRNTISNICFKLAVV